MGRVLKPLLYTVVGVVALLVMGVVGVLLFFDPNDYRENIAVAVKAATGRELIIEGELEISVYPWLAIEIGRTRLGNGEGFGDEPFASFERASLSVRLIPLLIKRDIEVSSAELDGLHLNLAVNASGRANWQDFIDASEVAAAAPLDEAADEPAGQSGALDVSSIAFRAASLSYSDAQSGEQYRLTDVNLVTGRVSAGEPIPLSGGLAFELQPAGVSGNIEMDTVITFDADANVVRLDDLTIDGLLEGVTEIPTTLHFETASFEANTAAETISLEKIEMSLLGLDISADVEPFSYANEISLTAAIQVDAFSLRSLMQRLSIEAPETADLTALGKVIVDATARVSPSEIALTDLSLVLDETSFTGELSIPLGDAGIYRLDLKADSIDLDRYMAPVADVETTAVADEPPIEIPSDMIRLINARGSLTVGDAQLGGMRFENVELGLNMHNGKLRLNPISATLFEGTYNGDVRIDASGDTAVMSVNEKIEGVQLGALALAMFDQDNINGTINGSFKLSGRGNDLAEIQSDLDGYIAFELIDGAWLGTDVWYELRRARASIKQEPPPEPRLPVRTQFSQVRASGPVKNGVFTNNDLLAELPFMRITGKGSVNLVEATLDYQMSAKVINNPEFVGDDITADELKDFTKMVVPIRVSGSLTAPKIRPDIGKMLQEQAKREVEEKLKKELEEKVEKELEDKVKDKLKDKLKDLFKF